MSRDYKKEYANYQGTPEQIKHRAQRNAARREMEKKGLVHKGDGKDVDHKNPIDRGGSNADSNLRVQTKHNNRNFKRDSKGRPI
jgi:5-methylcytosine-specific restriction endonuclease McrA